MHKFAAVLLFCASSALADVVLEVPKEVSFFEAPAIRVTGLPPLRPVTIRASCADGSGATFTSSAEFTPHIDGVVDTRQSIGNGDYHGVDAMGLFWSLNGKNVFQLPPAGSLETTIDVLDDKGQVLASGVMSRRLVPADVSITELRRPASPFVARFYQHAGGGKRAAVLTLTGSNGGIDERMAPMLASNGYNVLALGYYHFEGLPDDLLEVPLEYFRDALTWMKSQPSVDGDRIAIVGASKGAEAALAMGAYYPDLARAIIAIAPTHVIWEGVDARARFGGDAKFEAPGRSSWSIGGKGLPFVHKVITAERLAHRPPTGFLDAYEPALQRPFDDGAVIPIERFHGAVFLVSAGDDIVWPSLQMGRAIRQRLLDHHFKQPVELREYPLAGHAIAPPGFRVGWALGGAPAETSRAGADAWSHALSFLKANLSRP